MSFIVTFIAAVFVFSAVIAIHEFGHFMVAKLCGVQVNEFSIGMGPVLCKRVRKGTQYSIRALPVGGFVALEGEESPESQQAEAVHTVQEQPAPETEASVQPTGVPLNEAPVWQRALVMVAGAVICGAMFGDKLSPLSDTTNLAPAVADAKLGDHIRSMLWTTLPTYVITLILFTILGFQQTSGSYTEGSITVYIDALNDEFQLGWITMIPAILIIVLLLCKVNAISALGLSSFAAGFVSYFVQHDTLQGIIRTAYNGYTTTIEEPVLQSILNRGGMGSMLQYVAIICFAVGMGGMLEKLGVLDHILQAIVKRINSDGSMILATMIVGYVTSLISCSQPMAHVLTGRLMAPVFQERKVAPEILSRCLEDSGTMAGPMIPWHGYGVYMAGTLGVAWSAFFPYLFLLYLTPVFSIFYGFTGISIKHLPETKNNESKEEK